MIINTCLCIDIMYAIGINNDPYIQCRVEEIAQLEMYTSGTREMDQISCAACSRTIATESDMVCKWGTVLLFI